jgi:DNA-directed RNA polymerase subunit F
MLERILTYLEDKVNYCVENLTKIQQGHTHTVTEIKDLEPLTETDIMNIIMDEGL